MNIHKWPCKLLGHKWDNPGILKTIDAEETVTFICRRCGEKQVSGISFVDDINEEKTPIKQLSNKEGTGMKRCRDCKWFNQQTRHYCFERDDREWGFCFNFRTRKEVAYAKLSVRVCENFGCIYFEQGDIG